MLGQQLLWEEIMLLSQQFPASLHDEQRMCIHCAVNSIAGMILSLTFFYQCTDGYTASGGKCTCDGYVCGGKCRSSKCAKPSHVSRRKPRAPACPAGYTMCGVADIDERNLLDPASRNGVSNFGQRPYECLETRSNIESCK